MPRENNFLLGLGEKLTSPVRIERGGRPKNPPYEFPAARDRLAKKAEGMKRDLEALPREACPNDEAVALLTLHPRYISKSDFPADFLKASGLRSIGSRKAFVKPDEWGIKEHPVEAETAALYVAAPRKAFAALAADLPRWLGGERGATDLTMIEDLSLFSARDKVRSIPDRGESLLEVVLHADGRNVLGAFSAYAEKIGATVVMDRRHEVGDLLFLPVRVHNRDHAIQLAQFTFLRVARGMPTLRPYRPGILRTSTGFSINLPTEPSLRPEVRVAVFDGGLPPDHAVSPWVKAYKAKGLGDPIAAFQAHGLGVTSALLFGSLDPGGAERPYFDVDHYRVLDDDSGKAEFMYLDVLDRILTVLDSKTKSYEFVNISLGPDIAIDDDDVTAWTAEIDTRLASGKVLAAVAAGNAGERDAASGLNRVQPPSDGVNVLAVGACDQNSSTWARAPYSSTGPGRRPGYVKPDGVAFGGSDAEPFYVLSATSARRADGTQGTSFATPLTLRAAAGIRTFLGDELSALTIRALMIQRADPGTHSRAEVGWGRFETNVHSLITCDDDEAIVVYQGEMPVGQHLRARVPLPTAGLAGMITITATLAIAPEVDPHHPFNYTRSGLEATFRPHSGKFDKPKQGKPPAHPQTIAFFSGTNLYVSEHELREGGHKWEPCVRNSQKFRSTTLHEPFFDIYYHHREAGESPRTQNPIPYALIVSVKAPRVLDLYNQVVRSYAQILQPIRPKISIPIPVRT